MCLWKMSSLSAPHVANWQYWNYSFHANTFVMKKIGEQTVPFSLFISDLHLCVSRPHITAAFLQFLHTTAANADALYILGDLFEYWAGDDDIEDMHHQAIIAAFRSLANSGVNLYFMHGNRDFLVSSDFCKAANITLLQDPTLINLHGKQVLLSHGDALCTCLLYTSRCV